MSKKIYIMRHGETDWNKARRFQGQTDIPLNEEGKRQAAALAAALKDVLPFDRIVTSDLVRAMETARIMSEGFQTPIQVDAGFREMDFGQWEGLGIKEIRARWPAELEEWFATGHLYVAGGETQEQLFDRVWGRFQYWADQPDYEKLAIVCHGGSCGTLFCGLLGKPPHEMSRYMP
ncbi:MAG: histidine phosphatase family protein, partial [Peptococcaceae bacterium]|nr:histidine phosphatase family protein [Peptococcaceae bacterium]